MYLIRRCLMLCIIWSKLNRSLYVPSIYFSAKMKNMNETIATFCVSFPGGSTSSWCRVKISPTAVTHTVAAMQRWIWIENSLVSSWLLFELRWGCTLAASCSANAVLCPHHLRKSLGKVSSLSFAAFSYSPPCICSHAETICLPTHTIFGVPFHYLRFGAHAPPLVGFVSIWVRH